MLIQRPLLPVALALVFAALAAPGHAADFSGTWVFNPSKSSNIGPMSQMELTTVIQQSKDEVVQKVDATMMGQHVVQELHFDLHGKPMTNDDPMSQRSNTVTRWESASLITQWSRPGAVPGTTNTSTETRYLSKDGRVMYVKTTRRGAQDVIMAYDKH